MHRAVLVTAAAALAAIVVAPVSPSHGLEYMAYYGVNVTAQASWLSLGIGSGSDADAYYTASNGRIKSLARMSESGIWDHGKGLVEGWTMVVTKWVDDVVKPRMANGTVVGVFLGDELCCGNATCVDASLDPLVTTFRELLGPNAILYENECLGTFSPELKAIPADLNYMGFDAYTGYEPGQSGAKEAAIVQNYAKTLVYPRLGAHQKVFLVPGTFACSNFSYIPLANSSASVVAKLDAYFQWAKADPLVAGFNPWHFNYRGSPQHGPPCDMQVGAAQMPDVVAKLAEIGQWIINNNTKAASA